MANRLADETSPYLLQHKDNPVDWYPWGEEALARAKSEDKPLLVSIGYSACHWCHVMEHESFEDPETAALMNEHFVAVKVDREERPDVDTIYMGAVQAMTGHGGWPLNVFIDPEGVPFYGGTYFPPEQRQGMPSFRQVLEGVSEAWHTRRDEIREAAPRTVEGLSATSRLRPGDAEPSPDELVEAEHGLAAQFDPDFGGFGGAPKFPPASALEFLMARIADGADVTGRAPEVVRTTLVRMARGGIYDQVGGGFARYSVDAHWLVPHFEKMLYDNALLARAYLHAWQLFGDDLFRQVCEETLDWALREMRGPEGGFYSALDADSEGVEGKFYVWSEPELRELLGEDADALLAHWGVDRGPNFEGASILYVQGDEIDPELLARARERLYDVRSQRVWPGLDDKRLTAWNALMVSALADAGAALHRADYLDAARECADFLLDKMRDDEGRLKRTYKDGRASLDAYLEDHAFLSEALLVLYEATLETRWFVESRRLADDIVLRFRDPEGGGFFDTASDHESLVVRPRSFEDHPIPSGSSSAANALLRIFAVTGDRAYELPALEVFRLLHQATARHPQAFGHLLQAMHFHFSTPREVALVGEQLDELAGVVHRRFHPTIVLAGMQPGDKEAPDAVPLLRGRELVDGKPAAYVCENFTCQMPVADPAELETLLSVRLGDYEVNRIGLGGRFIQDAAQAAPLLQRALDLGVNLIDTADVYGNSENALAEALHPYPEGLVIATKGGQTLVDGQPTGDGRPEYLREACERSLQRLRVETIDLYQLHMPDPNVPLEESVGALDELRREGKVRNIGVSNVFGAQLELARRTAPIVSVQNRYSLMHRNSEAEIAICEREGMAYMPWWPLGGGELARLGARRALAWLLQRSPAMLPIPGTANIEHLEENVAATAVHLTPEEAAELEAAATE